MTLCSKTINKKILTRDKILSKDSVRDLFALFFNMSNLNLEALLDTSFTAFSVGGCEACKCIKTEMEILNSMEKISANSLKTSIT